MNVEKKKFSLRKNDVVQVIAGREKGKMGKVLKVDPRDGRVTVENLNMVKRHARPTAAKAGGIIDKELPIQYSNVLIHCTKCNRGVRHGYRAVQVGKDQALKKKVRVCKRCDENLDVA